jgi:virginiamycin B lyase
VIDARTSDVVADLPVDEWPYPITAGSGSIWVGNDRDQILTRIDPGTRRVVKRIGFGHPIHGLAVGEGSLWVASSCEGVVRHIDPYSNEVARDTIRFRPRQQEDACVDVEAHGYHYPIAMVFGNGSLWVGNRLSQTLLRIDPEAGRVIARISNVDPQSLAFGDGIVWMVSYADEEVIKVDSNLGVILAREPVPRYPHGIVVGEEAIWVAHDDEGTISEIDPLTATVRRTFDRGATGLTADRANPSAYTTAMTAKDGVIWVANGLDHTISRINEVTREKKIIFVGFIPFGLAASGDAIWATLGPWR